MRRKWFAAGVLLLSFLLSLPAGCTFFFDSDNHARTGSFRVSVAEDLAPQTVVPDVNSEENTFDLFTVALSSQDGFPPLTESDDSPPWSVTFSQVREGTWDVGAQVSHGGIVIGSATQLNQLIAADTTADLSMIMEFAQPAGELACRLTFPAATGIDYVSGELAGAGIPLLVPELTTSEDQRVANFSASGIPAGTYPLVLTFRRGGSVGALAGVFREQVIVRGGFTSDAWVGPGGALLTARAFAADDFFETNANLAGLRLRFETGTEDLSGTLIAGEPRNIGARSLHTRSVWITAERSIAGQFIRYALNGGPEVPLASNVESTEVPLAHTNTLLVRVTAPDRQNEQAYAVIFRLRELVIYHANGADGGVPPGPAFYDEEDSVPVLDNTGLTRAGYAWTGWNTEPDGTGVPRPAGSTFIMHDESVTLYARWIAVHAVTVTFGITNPAYGVITFSNPAPVVQWGQSIEFTTELGGATEWRWYLDNDYTGVTAPTFVWNTEGVLPGHYIINVNAMYGGYPCTGSVRVTVRN